jgi:rhodanese-related sulfurtransferase
MQQIAPAEAATLIASLRAQGLQPQLLDVREPIEIALARIEPDGSRLLCIPMQQVPARLAEIDPSQPVLGLCHHGVRSAQVLLFLERNGYPETYNIADGIDAWSCHADPAVPRY